MLSRRLLRCLQPGVRLCLLVACLGVLAVVSTQPHAQSLTEGFDDISTLPGAGWFTQNNSVPPGAKPNWFQGEAVAGFPAYNGAGNSYIAANYESVAGANTISNWLGMPNRVLRNGDVLSFYTRKATADNFPDRLEVRLSTNGASTDVGTGATGVGDFSTLMLSINPTLVTGVYPTAWTQYTITISGLPAPTSGRLAFRYFVTNGGSDGSNSDYIGIDQVQYTPYSCPSLTVFPATLPSGVFGQGYSVTLSQSGALGAPTFAVTAGALPSGFALSSSGAISGTPTAAGQFDFTVTVHDASGCSGSRVYSLVVAPIVPQAPQSASAVAGSGQATVSWQAPLGDGGDPITGYVVTAVEDGSKSCSATGALSCTVMGLNNGTAYSFSVVALNGAGASAAAVSNSATPQGAQSISFANPGTQVAGATLVLSASVSSGLPVAFSVAGDCTLSGSSLSLPAVGSCTVTATQAGDAAWLPAANVVQVFAVSAVAAVMPATPVPTLDAWALALLSALMALGVARLRLGRHS